MTTNDLYAYMEHPSRLSADTLPEMKALYEAYPYCSTFVFLYLYNMYVVQDVRYASELRRLAPYLPDRRKLYLLVEQYTHPEQLQPASAEKEPDAFSLIDDFLDEMTRSGADLPSEISYGGASSIPSASDYFAATSPADQAEPSRSAWGLGLTAREQGQTAAGRSCPCRQPAHRPRVHLRQRKIRPRSPRRTSWTKGSSPRPSRVYTSSRDVTIRH